MNLELEAACDSKHGKWRSADVKTAENVDFSTLLLPDRIQLGLKNCGFEKPSPVQLQAIPLGRCGIDLVVQAKSGTGKTCVMAVIALDSLIEDSPNTQVLILAPTREIASQICGVIQDLGYAFPGLTCETFIGGLPLKEDKAKLPYCQIVVGTPGRIKQLIDMEILQTESVRLFVVDEADRLFDKQFKDDINWIFSSLPSRKQILALSATYPEELSKFLALYMETPVYVRINSKDPALLGITQCFRSTPYHPMLQVRDNSKFDVLLDILNSITFTQCMIFCQRQTKAQDLADNLVLKGFPSLAICSSLDQVTRLEIINELKSFKCRVLVSTDLTARGIDAENVDLVINFEMPYEAETYLHRIGRAGRYGTRGMSISLASAGDELKRLKTFQRKFLFKIYELPDPIPANLWDKLVTLQALEPDGIGNGQSLSSSSGSDNANGLNGPSHENKPKQPLPVNHSNIICDESEMSVTDAVCCNNNTMETSGAVLNGGVLPDNLEKTEAFVNETKQLIRSDEKTHKTEVDNPNNTTTAHQIQSEIPNQGNNYRAESKIEANGDAEENTSVEIVSEKSIYNDNIGVPKEASAVFSSSEMVDDIAEENSASFFKPDLHNSIDVDLSKEDLNNNGIMTNNAAGDHDELIKNDSPGVLEESECESPGVHEKQVVQSKVASCSLFQKWEKYFHDSEQNTDISNEVVSDILMPLLNSTKDPKSILPYSELVHSWECHSDPSVSDPIEAYSTSVSDRTDIPQAQMEVLQKYIWQDKCKFFSRVQRIFEMENELVSCERETSASDSGVCEENPDVSPAFKSPSEDDQLESKSASIVQNENGISCGMVDLDQGEEPLKNAAEDQNCHEVNSLEKKNENAVAVCANTCKVPDAGAINCHVETDDTVDYRFLPFRSDTSVGKMKEDRSEDDKHNAKCTSDASRLTDAVYNSVTCGIKYSKIVSFPSVPNDPPEESNSLNGKGSASTANVPHQKSMEKNQSWKKKVRGKSKKHKLKYQENVLNSVQVPAFEQSVSNSSGVVERNGLPFPAPQETETGQFGKNVTFDNASVPHRVAEQRDVRKKRGKVMTRKNKHFPAGYEDISNLGSGDHVPHSFTNGGMVDSCSPCVASFAPHCICCCRLPHSQQSDYYLQSPVPFQNVSPQYYYKKFLEQWYYIQELTYSYRR